MTVTAPLVITDREKRITLIALLIVFLLGALDMTIISTAMPRIIADLNGLELFAWVSTAYMLSSTVLVPIYGKLGDIYGRRNILIIGIVIFLLGSVLCGLSGEFGTLPFLGDGIHQLIIFRAVKGIGGAALFTSAFAIIADIYPPRERAKFMGFFGAMFAIASIVGPAIGGFLTDYATVTWFAHEIPGWRWIFYVNIPLGLVALFMIISKTPRFNHAEGGYIDFAGAFLLVVTFVPLLLALTWGGRQYAWDSIEIFYLFAGSFVGLCLFVVVELKVPNPVLPLSLFKIPAFIITNLVTFVVGMAFLGIVIFMPLYMQIVQGVTATNSGVAMFPLMFAMMFSSILSGRLVSRHGRYKAYIVGGNVVLVIGVYFFTRIGPDTSTLDLAWRMGIVGLGLGPAQSLTSLVVQSSVPPSQIGIATSSTQFFRQIGSTIGIALFGTFLTHNLAIELPKQLPTIPGGIVQQMDLSQAQSDAMNPDKVRAQIQQSFENTYQKVDLAFHGDVAAKSDLLENASIPEALKQSLRNSEQLSSQQIDSTLALIESGLDQQVTTTTNNMMRGFKVSFSNSITGMFNTALGILLFGFLLSCFIPVIPLHSQTPSEQKKADGSEGHSDKGDAGTP